MGGTIAIAVLAATTMTGTRDGFVYAPGGSNGDGGNGGDRSNGHDCPPLIHVPAREKKLAGKDFDDATLTSASAAELSRHNLRGKIQPERTQFRVSRVPKPEHRRPKTMAGFRPTGPVTITAE